ncbi:DUF1868 domain-containing protein [Leptolyngbya sp. FACHB-17]|uniref:DUF1868 domain-containing protein n=1 Tax=unclassified Leptolyngbya TaxID=2650499 RepID=UPI0016808D06|nr:DUF1868 domain-containing protein [Leptolyngbya sp. FACHB-17]MBD2081140.1 DUF1868 domain-containing protein [Leptolyngbya sp. FACHB-17]
MDENYQTFLNRVMRLTLPDTYKSQVQHIQKSPKFQRSLEDVWLPTAFPGYTVITPPGSEDGKNRGLYESLKHYQNRIAQTLGAEMFAPIPADSFHVTVADLIWNGAYLHAAESPGFDERLRDRVAGSFRQSQPIGTGEAIRFQVVGLMVMARAIAVCLATVDSSGYERILKFRRSIYQNPGLIEIGIEQQYYFTPHITLGYFGKLPTDLDRAQLSQTFDELNQDWLDNYPDNEFWIHQAEFRKFNNMVEYLREPDWATFQF